MSPFFESCLLNELDEGKKISYTWAWNKVAISNGLLFLATDLHFLLGPNTLGHELVSFLVHRCRVGGTIKSDDLSKIKWPEVRDEREVKKRWFVKHAKIFAFCGHPLNIYLTCSSTKYINLEWKVGVAAQWVHDAFRSIDNVLTQNFASCQFWFKERVRCGFACVRAACACFLVSLFLGQAIVIQRFRVLFLGL